MLILTHADVAQIMNHVGIDAFVRALTDRLDEGFRRVHVETAMLSPARGGFDRPEPVRGVIEWMPHREPGASTTVKLVSYSPNNPGESGLPTISACLTRFDDRTGHTTVVADGTLLTALRTGAASALASRALAHPESRAVGVIGCGVQAVAQVHALSLVFPLDTVLAWDTDSGNLASFRERIAFTGLNVMPMRPDEMLSTADIMVTATSVAVGKGPVVEDGPTRPHLHINAVGSDVAGKTELPRSLVDRALVCPDHPEQAAREGECQVLDPKRIGPPLSAICADPAAIAHDARHRLTIFDSTGVAMEDHIALDLLLALAGDRGLGTEIDLENKRVADTANPYTRVKQGPR